MASSLLIKSTNWAVWQ